MERYDALEVFVELYPAIIQSLADIAEGKVSVNWSSDTVKDACGLLAAIVKFSFLVTLVVVQSVMGYLKTVTKLLQERSLDIVRDIALMGEKVQKLLEEIRADIDEWHSTWFTMAREISEEGTEGPDIPRRCGQQNNRDNVEAETPEVYYRCILTIPFLDHLISQLQQRFTEHATSNSS